VATTSIKDDASHCGAVTACVAVACVDPGGGYCAWWWDLHASFACEKRSFIIGSCVMTGPVAPACPGTDQRGPFPDGKPSFCFWSFRKYCSIGGIGGCRSMWQKGSIRGCPSETK